ncbi:MAG: DEAD/DEAH box helicase [Betaproteobacteria bacterium]|nr:DEAD/DEAH box helicase [Betaproteobacteria bacterium]
MSARLTFPMIVAELEGEFGVAAIAKAAHLHAQRDTEEDPIRDLTATIESPATWRVTGRVQGSAPAPYASSLEVRAEPHLGRFEVIDAECSCPVESFCKHGAALLLRWVSRWDLAPDGRSLAAPLAIGSAPGVDREALRRARAPNPPADPTPQPPLVRRMPLAPELQAWLQADLEPPRSQRVAAHDAPGKPGEGRHESIIAWVASDAGHLHALRARRLRSAPAGTGVELTGERASGLWVRHDRELPSHAREADRAIFVLCESCKRGNAFYGASVATLEGATGFQLLDLARATGRLHALREADLTAALGKRAPLERRQLPPALATAAREAATLLWQVHGEDDARQLRLGASIRGRAVTLLPIDPPHAIDIENARLIPVDIALSVPSLVRLSTLPALPKADAVGWAYVRDALEALPDARHVPPLPLDTPVALPLPRAILQFAWVEHQYQHGWGRNAHTESLTFPGVHLWFDYAGRRVPVNAYAYSQAVEAEIDHGVARATHLRNVRAEAGWLHRLPAQLLPAVQVERTLSQAALDGPLKIKSLWALPQHDWAAHGAAVLADAQAAGFELEVDPAFPLSMQDVPEADLELSPANERGWFRLSLGVMVEGERVDIAPALAKLIGAQADPEAWLAALPSVPTLLLTAKSSQPAKALQGRALVVRLPGERVHAILAPVFDWFRGGAVDDMSALQAALHAGLPPSAVRYLGREDPRWIALRDAVGRGAVPAPVDPAPGFAATLRPYQRHGLIWLEHLHTLGMSGVLADDMGLGKTVQTLAFLHRRRRVAGAQAPSLIVAPTSVAVNWLAEAKRFTPDLKVLVHHGQARSLSAKKLAGADLVLTSYPILQRDEKALAAAAWDVVVFDEAQSIKNPKAKTYQAAQSLKAGMRLALTGTPMENHLGDLWTLYNLLLPGLLGDLDGFNRVFRHPIEQRAVTQQMTKLRERIRPFLLRRTREAVLGELPEKTEYTRWIELHPQQADLYESLRTAVHEDIRRVIDQKGLKQSTIHILDALLKLRQVCCDPRLVKLPDAQARFSDAGSAKLDWLMTHLAELVEEGRRVLVFSQFTSMLTLIADGLHARGIAFESLTGDTRDRETPIARFQGGAVQVFLLSLKAGGVGLNLTAADTVIHYDPWWNPAVEAQATARAHRIGQTQPVFVTRLVCRGTLEERMLTLLARKRELASALLEGEGQALSGLTLADVESLLAPIDSLRERSEASTKP